MPLDPQVRLEQAEQREDDARVAASAGQADAEAERRVRELEHIQMAAEAKAAEARLQDEELPGREAPPADPSALPAPLADELRLSDQQIARRRERDEQLRSELEQSESRIEADRSRTERALDEARKRLEQIEAQAGDAEERAARAERLAEMRRQEVEREQRLHEMLERINEAERNARDAEARARAAVAGVSRSLDPGRPEPLSSSASSPPPSAAPPGPASSEPERRPVFREPEPESESPELEEPEPEPSAPSSFDEISVGGAGTPESEDVADRTSAAPDVEAALTDVPTPETEPAPTPEPSFAPPPEPEPGATSEPEPSFAPAPGLEPAPAPVSSSASSGAAINLNEASFEELRGAGLSVTQTGRVLAHRERGGGFHSLDELDEIPGFPRDFLDQVKPRLTV